MRPAACETPEDPPQADPAAPAPAPAQAEPGRILVCACCGATFFLPDDAPANIRYIGRSPQLECDECSRGTPERS